MKKFIVMLMLMLMPMYISAANEVFVNPNDSPAMFVSNVMEFKKISLLISEIHIKMKNGVGFLDMPNEDYLSDNPAQRVIDLAGSEPQISFISNIKDEMSQHIFPNHYLTNDCSVLFYPAETMIGIRASFNPSHPIYFYEINIFFRSGVKQKDGTIIYYGVMNQYTHLDDPRGIAFVSFPVQATFVLDKPKSVPQKSSKKSY